MNETSKHEGDGGIPPDSDGAVLCLDGAEARVLRRSGRTCITGPKMRRLLGPLIRGGHVDEALAVVGRLGAMSNSDDPATWPMWKKRHFTGNPDAERVRRALSSLPVLQTPLKDPENVTETAPRQLWSCSGTTILVAKNTFELVRVADTYVKSDCYRPRGRMDEPFHPQPGRVCLITEDELRLVRLTGEEDVSIVLTFKPADSMREVVVTRWPSPIRAMCGEYPGLAVGVAPWLVENRHGMPFALGLTRGVGYETTAETDVDCDAAFAYCYETNNAPEAIKLRVVVWAGGDDVRQLVRYGGLSIFTGQETRRKVQLRSLGLVKSGTAAGVPVYDMTANYNILTKWAITRTFAKPEASQRERNHRRVRPCKASAQYARGMYIIQETSPRRINRTPKAVRQEASDLRKYLVGDGCGVTPVPLISLGLGGTYFLNGRAKVNKEGEIVVDAKRSKIRCPRWTPKDAEGMLKELAEDKSVVFAGREASGKVFAVVKVANGTEDQQREAVSRWSHGMGLRFPDAAGCSSWSTGSIAYDSPCTVSAVTCTNWKALSLETGCFERYQTQGDYGKPLKLTRRGVATLSARASAYAETVPLDEEGTRNSNLSGAMLNIRDKFGKEALTDALPYLLAKSTLPSKEKNRMVRRVLNGGSKCRK